jgi:hypothetical protein
MSFECCGTALRRDVYMLRHFEEELGRNYYMIDEQPVL